MRPVIDIPDFGTTTYTNAQTLVQQVQETKGLLLFVSERKFSMHDVLRAILDATGPADVHIATWSITEAPAVAIAKLKESGAIRQLQLLLADRIPAQNASALAIIRKTAARIGYLDCHAKVLVVRNEMMTITVSGSANFTNNRRLESGFISTHPQVATWHLEWIEKHIAHGRGGN